jgi:hypothetical protein
MSAKFFRVSFKKENFEAIENIHGRITATLVAAMGEVNEYLKAQFLDLMNESGPNTLGRRSGKLRSTVRTIPPTYSKQTIKGGLSVGEGVPYAQVHIGTSDVRETHIFPRSAQALAIPLRSALTSRGVIKSAYSGGPREIPGLFTRGKNKRLRSGVLYQQTEGGKVVPLFLLRRSVTVPRRIFTDIFIDTHAEAARAIMEQYVTAEIEGS